MDKLKETKKDIGVQVHPNGMVSILIPGNWQPSNPEPSRFTIIDESWANSIKQPRSVEKK